MLAGLQKYLMALYRILSVYRSLRQGILDVGLTEEDKVELVKTHLFTRKHATGKAKIELHVLQVKSCNIWHFGSK